MELELFEPTSFLPMQAWIGLLVLPNPWLASWAAAADVAALDVFPRYPACCLGMIHVQTAGVAAGDMFRLRVQLCLFGG